MHGTLTYKPFGAFRLVLAACVVLQHIHPVLPRAIVEQEQQLELGTLGVYMFFMASGYIITEAITRVYSDRPWAFIANRAIRILPPVLLIVTLTAIMWAVFIAQGDHISVRAITLIGASVARLFPVIASRITSEYEILGVMWALRVEFTFYLLCFLVLFAVPYLTTVQRQSVALIGGTFLLGLLFAYDCTRAAPSMLRFIPYFLCGTCLYLASSLQVRPLARIAGVIAAVAFVGILIEQGLKPPIHETAGFTRDRLAQTVIMVLLIALFTALSFIRIGGRLARFDRLLGDLSYPLYVVHDPIIIFVALYLAPSVPTAITTAVTALIGAWLLYTVLERPLIALRTRIRRAEISFAEGTEAPSVSAMESSDAGLHLQGMPSTSLKTVGVRASRYTGVSSSI